MRISEKKNIEDARVIDTVKHLVRPEHLNGANTLFGGTLLAWIDEAAAISAIEMVGGDRVATVAMSNIVFERPVHAGDLIRITIWPIEVGSTSISFRARVTVRGSRKAVITVERIVFVTLDKDGRPKPHGVKKILPKTLEKK